MKTLWCKNQENPSDRISHAWAPLKYGISLTTQVHLILATGHVRVAMLQINFLGTQIALKVKFLLDLKFQRFKKKC